MTTGNILFCSLISAIISATVIFASRGEGVEIPSSKQLTALAIAACVLATFGELCCWIAEYGCSFWAVME
jgi:hypothetical protein